MIEAITSKRDVFLTRAILKNFVVAFWLPVERFFPAMGTPPAGLVCLCGEIPS
jgi:hypothetical protein